MTNLRVFNYGNKVINFWEIVIYFCADPTTEIALNRKSRLRFWPT